MRRIIDSDTNEDTLWLCTNKEEEDEESITLTEKTGAVEQEETFWRFKRKEELKRLDDPTALVPKTMSQVEFEDTDQANDEKLKQRYEDDLQKKIKTIDFFEASTTVKKSNIIGYGDYNSNNRWALLFLEMTTFFMRLMRILKMCDSFHTTGMCSKVTALMRRNGTRYVQLYIFHLSFLLHICLFCFFSVWLISFHKGLRDHRRGPLSAKTEKREQRQRIFVWFKPRFLLKLLN